MKQLFFLILVLSSIKSYSQNWRTVPIHDTTYYVSDDTLMWYPNMLRVIWVDSVVVNSNDSVSYFYKTIGYPQVYSLPLCLDSTAATWLGKINVRKVNGDEYFINYRGDSLLIKTNASLGDTWQIASDSNGVSFIAEVTNMDTMTIDGVLDSSKTLKVQAYQVGALTNHFYSNKEIILSKNHGFVNILEFRIFPYPYASFSITNTNNGVHHRVPYNLTKIEFGLNDLDWKYALNNEWITKETHEFPGIRFTTLIHDSVLNYIPFGIDSGIAYLHRTTLNHTLKLQPTTLDTTNITTQIVIDTVYRKSVKSFTIRDSIFPEVKTRTMLNYTFPFIYNDPLPFAITYYLNFQCDSIPLLSDHKIVNYFIDTLSNCFHNNNSTAGHGTQDNYYFQKFDSLYNHNDWIDGFGYSQADYKEYVYYNMSGCLFGNKSAYAPLITLDYKTRESEIILYPNPALNKVSIYTSDSGERIDVQILDLLGNRIMETQIQNQGSIDLSNLNSGIYIVKTKTKNKASIQKIHKL